MIKLYPFKKLGEFKNDWLHARYHFSFSEYFDPQRMGFGPLRVINDDTIKSNTGFPPHGHSDMEIITYVRKGEVKHSDSLGNSGSTKAGDVQVMSAGTGIQHAEFSGEGEDTLLYQIWIRPNKKGVEPRWEAREFPKDFANDELPLLVSGRARDKDKNALFIHQDAAIYGGKIASGKPLNMNISDKAYVLVSKGDIMLNGKQLSERDGAEIEGEQTLRIEPTSDAEVIVIDVGN